MTLLGICLYLIFIGFSWWALQEVKFEIFLKQKNFRQSKLLHILLSIALGYQVANFFIEYLGLSMALNKLFIQ
jgi:uncharacterized integral membrane protein (TIGR02327 family)